VTLTTSSLSPGYFAAVVIDQISSTAHALRTRQLHGGVAE
jgi:hypothetical protein